MKHDRTEEKLAKLRELAANPKDPAAAVTLREALLFPSAAVVSTAARIIEDNLMIELRGALEDCLSDLLEKPAAADRGCLAKTAVASALYRVGIRSPEVLKRSLKHIQMDPVWGKSIDTAGNLRGTSALALAAMRYPGVLFDLAPLLVDPETEARRHAVAAVASAGDTEAELMIRVKVLCGDADPEVTAEALSALMHHFPQRSFGFVGSFLDSSSSVIREGAAMAIAESHVQGAFGLLKERWSSEPQSPARRWLLLPMSLVRSEEAFGFLLEAIEHETAEVAIAALEASRLYAGDEDRFARIRKAARRNSSRKVKQACLELDSEQGQ